MKIRTYGDDILRRRSAEVETFDEALVRFAADMAETMDVEDGVGLAAPQVGVSRRVIVVNHDPGNPGTLLVMINPRIVSSGDETTCVEEGCLSVPGVRGKVTRPDSIEVEYMDETGNPAVLEAGGLLSRIIQHEIDHLDGVLFVDRLSLGSRTLLRGRLRQLAGRAKRI